MIRLEITTGPRWIDLGMDVRVEVLPLNSTLMASVWADPALARLTDPAEGDAETEGLSSNFRVEMNKAIARLAIVGWEGVGDKDGNPIDPTPTMIDALLDLWPLFTAFHLLYVQPGLRVIEEGNASAPSPNGTSAEGASTADPARKDAKRAHP